MRKSRLIFDDESFTADTDLKAAQADQYVDGLAIGLSAQMTAASAVSAESVLGVLSTIEVRRLGSPVINISAQDLLAINTLFLGKSPLTLKASAATNAITSIRGLWLPLRQPPTPHGGVVYKFYYTSVSGVDTEKLTVAEIYSEKTYQPTYFHAVKMPGTTAATTGYGNIQYPTVVGDLVAIVFYSTTIPTQTSDAATVQKVKVYVEGVEQVERTWLDMRGDATKGMQPAVFGDPGNATIIDNYALINFEDDPIPAGATVKVDVNAGVANEAYTVIPIYLVAP